MIGADTISTGSGWTASVAGRYWITSISRLRNTTTPLVMATTSPTGIRLRRPPPACLRWRAGRPARGFPRRAAGSSRPPASCGPAPPDWSAGNSTATDVEHLPRAERHDLLVVPVHAFHPGGGVVPPLLRQQEGLADQVERRGGPGLRGEPAILCQRLDQRPAPPPAPPAITWCRSRSALRSALRDNSAACPARPRDGRPSRPRPRAAPPGRARTSPARRAHAATGRESARREPPSAPAPPPPEWPQPRAGPAVATPAALPMPPGSPRAPRPARRPRLGFGRSRSRQRSHGRQAFAHFVLHVLDRLARLIG